MKKHFLTIIIAAIAFTGCEKQKANISEYTVNGVKFNMIAVEGGTFAMGDTATAHGAEADEAPTHKVTVDNFKIGETEVTQELWSAVMGSNPSGYQDNPLLPVESVSWHNCQEFIKKLNELTGEKFRLPTEAEWEYAARGGKMSKGYLYSGSDSIGIVAWYADNAQNRPQPVKQKQPNELGIYDMSGNIWEWCHDIYGKYSSEECTNPTGPAEGHTRVLRGGCWLVDAPICRPADRSFGAPKSSGCIGGMRLAQ